MFCLCFQISKNLITTCLPTVEPLWMKCVGTVRRHMLHSVFVACKTGHSNTTKNGTLEKNCSKTKTANFTNSHAPSAESETETATSDAHFKELLQLLLHQANLP